MRMHIFNIISSQCQCQVGGTCWEFHWNKTKLVHNYMIGLNDLYDNRSDHGHTLDVRMCPLRVQDVKYVKAHLCVVAVSSSLAYARNVCNLFQNKYVLLLPISPEQRGPFLGRSAAVPKNRSVLYNTPDRYHIAIITYMNR